MMYGIKWKRLVITFKQVLLSDLVLITLCKLLPAALQSWYLEKRDATFQSDEFLLHAREKES